MPEGSTNQGIGASVRRKEDKRKTKIKKEPLSFVSEKVILQFEIFAFFLSVVVYKRLKRTKKRTE